MAYVDIFTVPDFFPIIISVVQTTALFCIIMLGLQLVGRRVFAQRGPQDLVIIVLVAEACDLGLTDEDGGFWSTLASVITLLLLGHLAERIALIRRFFSGQPIPLFEDGTLHKQAMRKHMVDVDDLDEVAREHGRSSYKEFKAMLLEADGQISAIEQES